MATKLTVGTLSARVAWDFENVLAWANASNNSNFQFSSKLADGTGAGQADRIYIAAATINVSSSITLDLAGSLTDIFGNTITFARVKVIFVRLTDATAGGPLVVGGNASNPFVNWIVSAAPATDLPRVRVRRPGVLMLATTDSTGYVVTAGTGDILKIENESGSAAASYELVIVGASA